MSDRPLRLRGGGGGLGKLFSCTSSSSLEDQPRRPSAALSSSSSSSSTFGRSSGHPPTEWPRNYHRQHAAHSSHRPSILQSQLEQQGQQLQPMLEPRSRSQRPHQVDQARRRSSRGQLGFSPMETYPAYAVPMSGRMPVPGPPMQQAYIPPSTGRDNGPNPSHGSELPGRPRGDVRTAKGQEDEETQLAERMMDW